jgi:hypothetical protein
MQKILLFLSLFLLVTFSYAQTGIVKGNIKDKNTSEGLVGATVMLEGTTIGTNTDIEGNFSFKATVGTYNLIISFISYKTQKIEKIKVENGKALTMNLVMEEDNSSLNEVVVMGVRETNTSVAVISEIKRMETVAVGVSSEQMNRTLDRDAGQAIKRVPGISIIDDKFVVVRGLSERYNTVLLNDVITPSSEVDSRAFSFDMIPTGALDKMLVLKSASAENPGDVAGGVIKLYTKGYSDQNSMNVSFSTNYRVGTTFQNALMQKASSTDFLGFDNSRKLPTNFPAYLDGSSAERADAARLLPQYYDASTKSLLPDMRFGFSLNRSFVVRNMKIGNMTAINYSNSNQFMNIERNLYDNKTNDTDIANPNYKYNDENAQNNVRAGIMHNWFVMFNPNNRIEFRHLFNQIGITENVLRTGTNFGNGFNVRNYAFRYESRSIYSGQLAGYHDLKNDKTKITWVSGFGYTNRQEPDYRRVRTRDNGSSENFSVSIPSGATTFDAARFYSALTETSFMGRGDVEHKIKLGSAKNQGKIRAGVYVERKDRKFNARWMSYTKSPVGFNNNLNNAPINSIFNNANVTGIDGFTMAEGTTAQDAYKANNTLFAAYISASLPITDRFTANIGLRGEFNDQRINSAVSGAGLINVKQAQFTPMPSANLTYNLTEKHLLRAAYAYTINRPEFRELAPFMYYDFNLDLNIQGNPDLKVANIHNVDLRYEWYPSEGEMISVGAFYKYFSNPIETQTVVSGESRLFVPFNAPSATSYGVELDIRKSLGTWTQAPILRDVSLVANLSLIHNQVNLGNVLTAIDKNRPMMFQSPYVANVGLFYNNEASKTQINLQYNVLGKRIFTIGDVQYPTQYEMPRHLVDLAASKKFGRVEVKLGISDLLNSPYRIIQDSGSRNGTITDTDETIIQYRRGTSVSVGVAYGF